MGFGDEIMAAGQAQAIASREGRRVLIVGAHDAPRWSSVWENNPWIISPDESAAVKDGGYRLANGPNVRPYISKWISEDDRPRAIYTDWEASSCRGNIFLTKEEISAAQKKVGNNSFVVLEHRVKGSSSVNKNWKPGGFQDVVDLLEGKVRFVTLDPDLNGDPQIKNTTRIETRSFREAAAVISLSKGYLGVEGGLHHAAAALSVPAVVLFGHFTRPINTGYPEHVNFSNEDAGCGRWAECDKCHSVMLGIQASAVADAVFKMHSSVIRSEAY